ncbi:MAG: mechanosensitive ion channel, partial [Agathobacter sp.]|nr:mechanosensitive ion channel [Agathobacter sp.]
GANLEQVKKVLTSVIEEEPLWLKEEPSNVYVSELGDSSVIMGVFLWVKAENYWEVKWRMTENIKLALDANDISIPFPQLEVQIQGK